MINSNKPDRKPNKWLSLIGIPFQMGITIVAFAYLGSWLDEKYPNPNNTYNIVFTMLGVGIALYNVVRQVNQINK